MKTVRFYALVSLLFLLCQTLYAEKTSKIDPRATVMLEKFHKKVSLTDSQKEVLLVRLNEYFSKRDLGGKAKDGSNYKKYHKEASERLKFSLDSILTQDQLDILYRLPQLPQSGNQSGNQ
jgi:hypothetical protein